MHFVAISVVGEINEDIKIKVSVDGNKSSAIEGEDYEKLLPVNLVFTKNDSKIIAIPIKLKENPNLLNKKLVLKIEKNR
ncbi:MAG: hypothetical protein NW226_05290 [Microscillaceae bacterium]|nr:hypothetical protein [Microscillaceae bacterium]